MKTLIFIAVSLVSSSVFAGAFDQFLFGLKKDLYFTRSERGAELTHHVRVTKFGPFGRVMNPDAIATYNDKLNVISLDENLLEGLGRDRWIKDARAIRGPAYQFTYHLSTIFHEMGHAELDVFIESGREPEDQMLKSHYNNVLKSFYKGNFRSFNPHMVFHEHFGYYRSDLIDFFNNEVSDIYMNNGFNKFQRRCFLNNILKAKLAEGISLEDFKKLFVYNPEVQYRTKVGPRYVYVKGKDIDLMSARNAQVIMDQTHNLMWAYHQRFYNFPSNQTELVYRMNLENEFKKDFEACRTKLWNEAQPQP